MKKNNLLLIAFMLVSVFCINAQSSHPLAAENQFPDDRRALNIFDDYTKIQLDNSATALRTTWIANGPKDNWFISLNGGLAVLMSEETRYMDFMDQLKPTVGFAVGKWFSPVWGLRLSATGAKLQGFRINGGNNDNPYYFMGSWLTGKNYASAGGGIIRTGIQSSYTDVTTPEGAELVAYRFLNLDKPIATSKGTGYTYDITYVGASVDFMLNLKNMFTAYNPKAFFNPMLYAGIGYAHTFKADDANPELMATFMQRMQDENKHFALGSDVKDGQTAVSSVMGKLGLQLNFRLSDSWDIFADGQALVLPEYFDRVVGDNLMQDFVFNATLGFTYRFNFRHFIKAPVFDTRELDALNREINELRNRPKEVCPPVVIPPPVQVEVPAKTVLTPVFFTLDSHVVRDNQLVSVARAAEFLVSNPGSRIQIAAYADRQTGNPAHNMRLSQNRANAVANVLVDRFGIERRRLEITYFGDTVQPFEENDWNRVAIFIIP